MTTDAMTSAPAGFERFPVPDDEQLPPPKPTKPTKPKSNNPLYNIPGRARTPRKTSAYHRGMFDALIGPRAEQLSAEPESIRAVHLSVAASGSMLLIRTDTTEGEGKKRVLDLSSTQYIDLTLPSGDEITIEVRRFARIEELPPAPEPEEPVVRKFARCNLLAFAGGEL